MGRAGFEEVFKIRKRKTQQSPLSPDEVEMNKNKTKHKKKKAKQNYKQLDDKQEQLKKQESDRMRKPLG